MKNNTISPKKNIPFGLCAKAPDLLETLPGLGKLKETCPKYIRNAEQAQVIARDFARNEIEPRMLEIDARCGDDPGYFDWDLWKKANTLKS